jgi:hypothetical protein
MSVLEKASDLIDCLGRAGEPVSLGYVRSALGMPKSSTHRLLSELAALGIVRRTEDGRYSLGPRLLYWGEAAADTFDLRAVAEQPMRRLRDELGESVHLYIRDSDARICIAGRCRSAPGRPESCCWHLPSRTSSAWSSAAPGLMPSSCPTHQVHGWPSSWRAFGTSAGRPRPASARRGCRLPRLPSSTPGTGWWPPSAFRHRRRDSGPSASPR